MAECTSKIEHVFAKQSLHTYESGSHSEMKSENPKCSSAQSFNCNGHLTQINDFLKSLKDFKPNGTETYWINLVVDVIT